MSLTVLISATIELKFLKRNLLKNAKNENFYNPIGLIMTNIKAYYILELNN